VAFKGWPAEALEFYEGLEADNSRSYWTANKAVYDEAVHAPMAALLAELEKEFGPGKIYRPYRDLRFSPDKTPYKTVIGASLAEGGYVQLSARGLAAASGMYHMAVDQLDRYRRAVAEDLTGERLEHLVAEAAGEKIVITARDSLKTSPRGYAKDHPRIGLLRHKGLIAWQEWPAAAWLGTAAAKERVAGFLRAAQPLREWLDKHVGESELVEER
jgi:uncharacterized protein (TIGR02453 family)